MMFSLRRSWSKCLPFHVRPTLSDPPLIRYATNTSSVMDYAMNLEENSKEFQNAVPTANWAIHSYHLQPRRHDKKGFAMLDPTERQQLDEFLHCFLKEKSSELNEEELLNDSKATLLNSQDMSSYEVNRWLNGYTIPPEEMAKCQTDKEREDLRRLYARQLRLECSVHDLAIDRFAHSRTEVAQVGRGSNFHGSRALLTQWHMPMMEAIEEEFKNILTKTPGVDRASYGPYLLNLRPECISVLTLSQLLNHTLSDPNGMTFVRLAIAVGRAFQEELVHQKNNDPVKLWVKICRRISNENVMTKTKAAYDSAGSWETRDLVKLGSALLDLALNHCKVSVNHESTVTTPSLQTHEIPAFSHSYWLHNKRRHGVIKCATEVYKHILDKDGRGNCLPWTARYLPMLVPPKPWTAINKGGYLQLQTKIMRHRDSAWQIDCANRGNLQHIFEALNSLSTVPWVINQEVYTIIKKIWAAGGNFGDLPSREDIPLPELPDENDTDAMKVYNRLKRKIEQKNRELHSLRCDTIYKLQVAEEFCKEEEFYFPYNMDFRGRVYPIPPNLNHLGSDLCRSLLIFRDAKPLGSNGLRWLKIHLANLYGVDKCSFDDRVAFVDKHLDKIRDSAENPLKGEMWWQNAEYPFLALGACFDIIRAMDSPNPEEYCSRIPIHQDGSCNGLQHYAALGRDYSGGKQVNLVPSDRPQDVYSGVAERVMKKIEFDAAIHLPTIEEDQVDPQIYKQYLQDKQRKTNASFLLGQISRKVVKQTVMTSVYGVTYIGARKQIQARLEENLLSEQNMEDEEEYNRLETDIYKASCYAAEVTMSSMGDLFTAARSTMDWLSTCARIVAEEGQPMSWITPMGLPVVQPYRRPGSLLIRTKMAHVILSLSESLPVSAGRQKSAFPPNFVHSLDSTHLLMTSLDCQENEITFAAVHDSYWTHACSVDQMNISLRQQFIQLYNQPLLEDLLSQLQMRFPQRDFPPIPMLGSLELNDVLNSPYFFN